MKNRINLLYTQDQIYAKSKIVYSLIYKLLLLNFILFLFLIILTIYNNHLQNQYKKNIKLKEALTEEANKKVNIEVEANLLSNKISFLNSAIDDDIKIKSYLDFIFYQLKQSTPEVKLNKFFFDKNRNFLFSFILPDQKSIIDFIELIETDSFRNQFLILNLNSFKITSSSQQEKNKTYNLIIEGKFKKIKNEQLF